MKTLAELQKDTLNSYLTKARVDSDKHASALDNPDDPKNNISDLVNGYFANKGQKKRGRKPNVSSDEISRRKTFSKLVNRETGIERAVKSLASKAIEAELNKKPRYVASPDGLKLKEEFPTNAMGTSSSVSGTGPVDTFDPILKFKKKILKRKTPKVQEGDTK